VRSTAGGRADASPAFEYPFHLRSPVQDMLKKMNVEHRTLNFQRRMKEKYPISNIQPRQGVVGRSMFDVHFLKNTQYGEI
jgi:hypothetical protein